MKMRGYFSLFHIMVEVGNLDINFEVTLGYFYNSIGG